MSQQGDEREALLRRTAHKMDFHPTRDDVVFLLGRLDATHATIARVRVLVDRLARIVRGEP